jgi:hypothetical protein
MIDPADAALPRPPSPQPAPTADLDGAPEPQLPISRHSRLYGRQPIDENASGRRARLRHPARGAARH